MLEKGTYIGPKKLKVNGLYKVTLTRNGSNEVAILKYKGSCKEWEDATYLPNWSGVWDSVEVEGPLKGTIAEALFGSSK